MADVAKKAIAEKNATCNPKPMLRSPMAYTLPTTVPMTIAVPITADCSAIRPSMEEE